MDAEATTRLQVCCSQSFRHQGIDHLDFFFGQRYRKLNLQITAQASSDTV